MLIRAILWVVLILSTAKLVTVLLHEHSKGSQGSRLQRLG